MEELTKKAICTKKKLKGLNNFFQYTAAFYSLYRYKQKGA